MARRLSEEEVKQISLRLKSARMLTGLTQESFSLANDIALMSLKCWEMGRVVPRQNGIANYLSGIRKHGIEVTQDWIFYGSGPGPVYFNGTQVERPRSGLGYIEQQADLFKKSCLSRGLNPILVTVKDDEMLPYFGKGDLIGGYYVETNELDKKDASIKVFNKPWLVDINDNDIVPRFLIKEIKNGSFFYRSNVDQSIYPYSNSLVGKISWHYSDLCEHT